MSKTSDIFGRELKYLRISVTDRCNFRCGYCMPNNTFTHTDSENILRYEDVLFAAEVFASIGVNRLRITGGEPLVRKDLTTFLAKLVKVKGIDEVMLTTNAYLLSRFASDIYAAGVRRLNISLDSLRPERNKYITGVDGFDQVIKGISAATVAGFSPIKINTVAIKGFNDDELTHFCDFAAEKGVIVRFIEFMPIGNSADWGEKSIMTGEDILQRLGKFSPMLLDKDINSGPAKNYKLNNGAIIGVITPISRHFCGDCDKLRLTADGKIRPCLLSDKEINLTEVLKSRDKNVAIKIINEAFCSKSIDHGLTGDAPAGEFKRTMSKIGG